jgi:hypothetical protein
METTLYEVKFLDGRVFRIFCRGKNQKKRFWKVRNKLEKELTITELSNGIHNIKEFEQLTK